MISAATVLAIPLLRAGKLQSKVSSPEPARAPGPITGIGAQGRKASTPASAEKAKKLPAKSEKDVSVGQKRSRFQGGAKETKPKAAGAPTRSTDKKRSYRNLSSFCTFLLADCFIICIVLTPYEELQLSICRKLPASKTYTCCSCSSTQPRQNRVKEPFVACTFSALNS
jgi:hypothetical protein